MKLNKGLATLQVSATSVLQHNSNVMLALSKTILLLAAAASAWMYNPPKKNTRCWPMPKISKPRVAGELQARACADASMHPCFLVSAFPRRNERGWIHESFWKGRPGLRHPAPLLQEMSCHPFHQSFGKAARHRRNLFFPSLTFLLVSDVLSQYLPTPQLVHLFWLFLWNNLNKTPPVSKLSFFSPQLIYGPIVLHARRKSLWHGSRGGWGNRLLWLPQNLFPSLFEDILFEVLHPSWVSKHYLK